MDGFIGMVMLVAFPFAPRGWMLCNGQVLAIQQNTALFALIGNQYGGNGTSTFALPNLMETHPMKDASGASLLWIICVEGIFPARD